MNPVKLDGAVVDLVVGSPELQPTVDVKITPGMIEAGVAAWWKTSGFYGPPDVEGGEVVIAIFKAMSSLYDAK